MSLLAQNMPVQSLPEPAQNLPRSAQPMAGPAYARHMYELDMCRELTGHGLCNGLSLAMHRMGVGCLWAFCGI
jgi:hypothetical protein